MAADIVRPGVVLAAPDSFKGTAGAVEIADAVARGAADAGRVCDPCPLSDGGEGFAVAMATAQGVGGSQGPAQPQGAGRWCETTVAGPLGSPAVARWWLADTASGPVAILESAGASGLALVGGAAGNDPMAASTQGTGELLVAAARAGARRVVLGVGGSATTDGGRGALDAVDEAGGLGDVELIVACDVDLPFVDAARVFGPQKGADPGQVAALTERLVALAADYRDRFGVDVAAMAGAGAAGGLAGGLAALGARLVPGFELVAEATGLRRRLGAAGLVVTGEGRLDPTSWSGKVVGGVLALAAEVGRPALVVAGSVDPAWHSGLGELPPPTVVDLSERFGAGPAREEPARCVTEAVRAELSLGRD